MGLSITQLSYILILVMRNTSSLHTLEYNDSSNSIFNLNESITRLFPLLDLSYSLCLISTNEAISSVFIEYCRVKNKAIILTELEQTSLDFCDSAVVVDLNISEDFDEIVVEHCKLSLYFLFYFNNPNLSELETLLDKSSSSEVVSIFLKNGEIFKLSSVFYHPRLFRKNSVDKILNHRMKSKIRNLRKKTLNLAYIPNPPFTIVEDPEKPDETDGIEFLLMKELSCQLNFTMKYISYKNWGSLEDSGRWKNGIVQAMQEGKADLAVANLWMIWSIYDVIDFGPSLNRVKIAFLVRRPEVIEFQWKNLATIFEPIVWVITALCFLLIVTVYWITINKNLHKNKQSWDTCLMALFGYSLMTSFHLRKGDCFVRYILINWSFFCLLLTTIISVNVFCRLSLPQYAARVDTVEQLVKDHYYWSVQYYVRFTSSNMRESILNFKNYWIRRFEKEYKYLSPEEVTLKAQFDKKVTFLVETYGDDFIFIDIEGLVGQQALEKFRLMREEVSSTHVTFGVAKNSTLLEPLTKMTLRFLEAGLLHQWKANVIRKWPVYDHRQLLMEKDVTTFSEPYQLSLNKLQPVFSLLLFGLTISVFVFFFENIW